MVRLPEAVLLVLLVSGCQGDLSVHPPVVPGWVFFGPQKPYEQQQYEANVVRVAAMDRAGQRYDVVMYGDSITQRLRLGAKELWRTAFKGFQASPLGVSGSTVEELAWRVVQGGEQPALDPKVVVLLCGINNLGLLFPANGEALDPSEHMAWLVGWMRAAMPSSRLLLLALLPNGSVSIRAVNVKYRQLAQQHGITWVNCNRGFNPANMTQYTDATHLTVGGYRMLLACLGPKVVRQLRKTAVPASPLSPPAPPPPRLL